MGGSYELARWVIRYPGDKEVFEARRRYPPSERLDRGLRLARDAPLPDLDRFVR
jgi:hypothetical protein